MNEEVEVLLSEFVMKYYVDELGNYLGGWDLEPPAGSVEVPFPPIIWDQVWDFESLSWSESTSQLAAIEDAWRDEQMQIARNNVTAIQFGDEDVPGTEQGWKGYWLALRKWTTDNPDFPDSAKRPVAPT